MSKLVGCSDSSMDDCNARMKNATIRAKVVQIPLWTIVTARHIHLVIIFASSDSSMDDCNRFTVPWLCASIVGSDSSMDDCNDFIL